MENIVLHDWKTNLHGMDAQHNDILMSLEQKKNDTKSPYKKKKKKVQYKQK